MSDDLLHRLDEDYDTQMEVERNPYGAWTAIQTQSARIRELESHIATYRAQVDAVLKDRALIIAERDRMRMAVSDIARQYKSNEGDLYERDFEGGFDACVNRARAALTAPSAKPHAA